MFTGSKSSLWPGESHLTSSRFATTIQRINCVWIVFSDWGQGQWFKTTNYLFSLSFKSFFIVVIIQYNCHAKTRLVIKCWKNLLFSKSIFLHTHHIQLYWVNMQDTVWFIFFIFYFICSLLTKYFSVHAGACTIK